MQVVNLVWCAGRLLSVPVGRAGDNKNENDKVADFDASRNLTTILLNDSQIALAIAPPISDELVPPRPTARAADTLKLRSAAPPHHQLQLTLHLRISHQSHAV